MKRKVMAFVLATSFFATAASAEKPNDWWFICKSFLNPQVCQIFR